MEQSILKSTKKILGIAPDDTSFDLDVMTHINSAFSDLHDLGAAPPFLEDGTMEWEEAFDDEVLLARVKTFVYLKVRLIFDPPQTSFGIKAFEDQIKEAAWRITAYQDSRNYVDPEPTVVVVLDE